MCGGVVGVVVEIVCMRERERESGWEGGLVSE